MSPAPSRHLHLDVLKAYAIVLVVLTHVAAPVFNGYDTYQRLTWGLFNVLNAWVRVCVPLFLMISGSLLIGTDRDESASDFAKRRLPPLLVPFAAWTLIYAWTIARFEGASFSLLPAAHAAISEPAEYHLWFMYMIIGVFLFAPVLRGFVRHRPADVRYGIVLWMAFLALQYGVPGYDNEGPAGTILSFGGYLLLGYALDREPVSRPRALAAVAVALGIVAGTSVAAYRMTVAGGFPENHYFGYLYPLMPVHAGAVFFAARAVDWKRCFERYPRLAASVRLLSAETFNVYLIHLLFVTLFTDKHLGFRLSERTGGTPVIGVPLTTAAVLVASLLTSALLQRLPVVSRLLVVGNKRG